MHIYIYIYIYISDAPILNTSEIEAIPVALWLVVVKPHAHPSFAEAKRQIAIRNLAARR